MNHTEYITKINSLIKNETDARNLMEHLFGLESVKDSLSEIEGTSLNALKEVSQSLSLIYQRFSELDSSEDANGCEIELKELPKLDYSTDFDVLGWNYRDIAFSCKNVKNIEEINELVFRVSCEVGTFVNPLEDPGIAEYDGVYFWKMLKSANEAQIDYFDAGIAVEKLSTQV